MKNRKVKRLLASAICIVLLGQGMVTYAQEREIDERIFDSVQAASEEVIGDNGEQTGDTEKKEENQDNENQDNENQDNENQDNDLDVYPEQKLVDQKTGITVEGRFPEGIKLGVRAISGKLAEHGDLGNEYAALVIDYNMKGYDVIQAYRIWFELEERTLLYADLPDSYTLSMPNPTADYEYIQLSKITEEGEVGLVQKNMSYTIEGGKAVVSTNETGDFAFIKKDESKKQYIKDFFNKNDNEKVADTKKKTDNKKTETRKPAPQTGDVENIVLLGMAFAASVLVLVKRKTIKRFHR